MLELIRNYAKGKRLDLGLSLGRCSTICQDAREFGNFRDPAPVILTLELNPESQARPLKPILAHAWHPRHVRRTPGITCERALSNPSPARQLLMKSSALSKKDPALLSRSDPLSFRDVNARFCS
jgi:hypothetical protein